MLQTASLRETGKPNRKQLSRQGRQVSDRSLRLEETRNRYGPAAITACRRQL